MEPATLFLIGAAIARDADSQLPRFYLGSPHVLQIIALSIKNETDQEIVLYAQHSLTPVG
jgi:hypothetical protein